MVRPRHSGFETLAKKRTVARRAAAMMLAFCVGLRGPAAFAGTRELLLGGECMGRHSSRGKASMTTGVARANGSDTTDLMRLAVGFATGLVASLAAATVAAAAADQPVPPATSMAEAQRPPKARSLFDRIINFRMEEKILKEDERRVEAEIEKTGASKGLFYEAQLLNLEAVLKAEESVVKDEERDLNSKAALAKDAKKLNQLGRLEGQLRFAPGENDELKSLQQLLPK